MAAEKSTFILPPQETYEPVTRYDDPLRFYYKPVVGGLYIKRLQNGLDLLKPPYERCLDFGYGSGLLFNTLDKLADELHGIDILSDNNKLTPILERQNIRAELKKADILNGDYPVEYFDLIVAFSVFEHIDDPAPILQEMHRIMRPGGQLLIGMPMVSRMMPLLFRMIGFKDINNYHITNHHKLKAAAQKYFSLAAFRKMPGWLPEACGLYFNMLFVKEQRQ